MQPIYGHVSESLYDFFEYHYHCTVTLSVAEVLSFAVEWPVNEYALES